jgi:hypothetical protein
MKEIASRFESKIQNVKYLPRVSIGFLIQVILKQRWQSDILFPFLLEPEVEYDRDQAGMKYLTLALGVIAFVLSPRRSMGA